MKSKRHDKWKRRLAKCLKTVSIWFDFPGLGYVYLDKNIPK